MHELVTDQGVLRVYDDGVLEFFRDLDGRAVTRVLLWGCDTVVDESDGTQVSLTVTRKRLPVVSVRVPPSERGEVQKLAEIVRRHGGGT